MLNELSKIMLGKNGNNHKEIKKKKKKISSQKLSQETKDIT